MAASEQTRERRLIDDFEARVLASRQSLEVTDGRVANRLRNRQTVIDSLFELIREGKSGTLDEVVERSGVARRSIFRYFTDLTDMMVEVLRRVVAEMAPLAVISNVGVGSLDTRIATFIEARLRTFALTHPFYIVARSRLMDLDVVRDGLNVMADMFRNQIRGHFAEELDDRPVDEVEHLVDSIQLLCGIEGYDILIRQQKRSIDAVSATWSDVIPRLLARTTATRR